MPLEITPRIAIADDEIELSFIRSSGAGGQNVNKVETAVQLRWHAMASPALSDRVRANVARLAGRRLTKDGVLVLTAQRFRTQERNRADALERLAGIIRESALPPPPVRRATRPTRASKERRLTEKKTRSVVKRARGPAHDLD